MRLAPHGRPTGSYNVLHTGRPSQADAAAYVFTAGMLS